MLFSLVLTYMDDLECSQPQSFELGIIVDTFRARLAWNPTLPVPDVSLPTRTEPGNQGYVRMGHNPPGTQKIDSRSALFLCHQLNSGA